MQRVAHPVCCGCGTTNPNFESTRFPTIRVCYTCLLDVADWLNERGLLKKNPLVQELFDGVFSGGTVPLANQYTVVVRSGFNVCSFILVERVEA